MAKRLMCKYCTVEKNDSAGVKGCRVERAETSSGEFYVISPVFRGMRQLARHFQRVHPTNKMAQKEAELLLDAVKANLRGGK